jgi:hypothetical protein
MHQISAPKLKGRPRRKRKKRSVSPGESSNESEASVASSVAASSFKGSFSSSGQSSTNATGRPVSSAIRRSERKTSAEEKRFVSDVQSFMTSRNTPLGKMPLLGYRQSVYRHSFLFYQPLHPYTHPATHPLLCRFTRANLTLGIRPEYLFLFPVVTYLYLFLKFLLYSDRF